MTLFSALFTPRAPYELEHSGHVLVLSDRYNPSVDYYISHRLTQSAARFQVRYVYMDTKPQTQLIAPGVFVVIVRHCTRRWLQYLRQHASRLSGVAFVMDDDLPSAWRCRDIPLDYVVWTSWRYWTIRPWLSAVCDRIWLSTPMLLEHYPGRQRRLVPPILHKDQISPVSRNSKRWAYHGSRMHQQELKWIVPIVAAVQLQVADAHFELFGNDETADMFAHIPRVTVLPYCSWADYLEYCQPSSLTLALAPLLPGRFNASRAAVKVYDMLRCGAVGVFSDVQPYQCLKASGISTVIDNDHDLWVHTIVRLITADDFRLKVYEEMRAWAMAQRQSEQLNHMMLFEHH